MTTTYPAPGPLRMSLADVARAAKVQRPVVSMWRSRSAGREVPFPQPATADGADELWDAAAIADWFRRSEAQLGHLPGNNDSVIDDLPRFTRIDPTVVGDLNTDTLAALLALAAITGSDLGDLTLTEVTNVARSIDPHDVFLLTEIVGAPINATALGICDELSNASYSARAALEALVADETRRSGGYAAQFEKLLAASVIAAGGALEIDPLRLTLLSPALVGVALAVADREPLADIRLVDCRDRATRSALRRLHAAGIDADLASDDTVTGPGVLLGDVRDLPNRDALDAVDDSVLQLGEHNLALFVGASAALTNSLTDPADVKLRDSWLRSGQLRMAARLPAGVMTHRHSGRLSLLLLGANPVTVPQNRLGVVTGDLGDRVLAELSIDDFVTDLVVATSAHILGRAHVLKSARLVPVPSLLAGDGDLVRRVVTDADADPSRGVDRSIAFRADEMRSGCGDLAEGWQVVPEARPTTTKACTIEHAIKEGWLRLVPGNRIRDDLLHAGSSGVRVLGVPELGGSAPRRIDRVELEWRYESARLTQPDDVVFAPAHGAMVDRVGDALALTPLRVLRVTDEGLAAGLSPEVIARDLSAQSAPARDVKLMRIRPIAAGQVAAIADRTSQIATRRAQLQQELESLEQLESTLVESVASGYARIESTTPDTKD
ncbi:hypothetical protein EU513_08985 [Yimella sp. RIT 621]|uniref:hypothetical protein n=1 Tax=Yimella sp. RIT 621 TaxID=2510323 RepID=UPI00101D3B08|nr:hypothetical protein [Yimella sp. RIT 621]RYG77072.1 hypothetical protein EU513_08985 [Yimella sp. RIT 621]